MGKGVDRVTGIEWLKDQEEFIIRGIEMNSKLLKKQEEELETVRELIRQAAPGIRAAGDHACEK